LPVFTSQIFVPGSRLIVSSLRSNSIQR
jgi:hypothetical protein